MTYDDNNIFAKILRGDVPSHQVYDDPDAIAFMDIMPQSRGHVLVVPKAASRNLLDADPASLSRVIVVVQRVALAARSAFAADGISLMQFNEDAGGQTVFHLHFHVIPRYQDRALAAHRDKTADPSALIADAAILRSALEKLG